MVQIQGDARAKLGEDEGEDADLCGSRWSEQEQGVTDAAEETVRDTGGL